MTVTGKETQGTKLKSEEQLAQSLEYSFPYHHLVELNLNERTFKSFKSLSFALSYALGSTLVCEAIQKATSKRKKELIRWVDVGCGDGALIKTIKPFLENLEALGVDYDPLAVNQAKRMSPSSDFQTRDNVSEEIGVFDLVSAIEVIEHIPPPELPAFLQKLGQLTTVDGELILTTPHINQRKPSKHFQHFSIGQLTHLVNSALPNFEIVEAYGFYEKNWLEIINKGLLQTKHFFLEMPQLNRIRLKKQLRSIPLSETKSQQIYIRMLRLNPDKSHEIKQKAIERSWSMR